MKLSIVTTLYQSAPYIEEFVRRVSMTAEKITNDYEIIMVDDGSPDKSLEVALGVQKSNPHICIIELSRNFGHHKALMTGLDCASGAYVFLIDSDLEEEPELLERFWHAYHNDGKVDVVYGIQIKRKGGLIERFTGSVFYKIFNLFSDTKIVPNHFCARLMSARYVKSLIKFKEYHPFLVGLMFLAGYEMKAIEAVKLHKHKSSYSIKKKMLMVVDSIISFSVKPLQIIAIAGITICCCSVSYVLYLFFIYIWAGGVKIIGWTSLILAVAFFGGLNLLSLGIVGIYIAKIYEQVKGRPYVVVKGVYGKIWDER